MKAYSMDLRQRVLAARDEGMGTAEAAETFAVSPAWIRRLMQRRRQTGAIAPRRPARPGPAPALADHHERLRALVRDRPGQTAAEYRDQLGVTVAVVTVWRALRRLGLTHKKSPSPRPSGTARTSPASGPRGGPR
jgi:transposase